MYYFICEFLTLFRSGVENFLTLFQAQMLQYNVAKIAPRWWHLKEISANVLIFIQTHPYGLCLKLKKS